MGGFLRCGEHLSAQWSQSTVSLESDLQLQLSPALITAVHTYQWYNPLHTALASGGAVIQEEDYDLCRRLVYKWGDINGQLWHLNYESWQASTLKT